MISVMVSLLPRHHLEISGKTDWMKDSLHQAGPVGMLLGDRLDCLNMGSTV